MRAGSAVPGARCSLRVNCLPAPGPLSVPHRLSQEAASPTEPLPPSNHSDVGGPLCFNKDSITESQSFPPFQPSSLPGFPLKVKRCHSRPKKGLNQDAKLF